MSSPQQDITQLLHEWRSGDEASLHHLMPLVYDELCKIAAAYLRHERADHTLQTAALVNEAYLRLIDQTRADWQNRTHFYGIAAQLMRRILVDHARKKQTAKAGYGETKLALEEARDKAAPQDVNLLALDEALKTLAKFAPRQSRIVELRYFGGLELDETAAVIGLSVTTVKREWNAAKAWLYNQLRRGDDYVTGDDTRTLAADRSPLCSGPPLRKPPT